MRKNNFAIGIVIVLAIIIGSTMLTRANALDDLYQLEGVRVQKVSEHVFVHTSYTDHEGQQVGANGMIVIGGNKAVLVDTPWTDAQTAELVDWIEDTAKLELERFIPTHAHEDQIGGLSVIKETGAEIVTYSKTGSILREVHELAPTTTFGDYNRITTGGVQLDCFFPGPSHTADTFVVGVENDGVLFGSCAVKSKSATDLGNVGEAQIDQWPKAIQSLKDRYSAYRYVIPGHGPIGDLDLLEHTAKLIEE